MPGKIFPPNFSLGIIFFLVLPPPHHFSNGPSLTSCKAPFPLRKQVFNIDIFGKFSVHGNFSLVVSTQENFPRKENFFKCDCPTQIFRRKQILKLKIFNFFNIDIFGKFSVHGNHGNFSLVEMGFNM
jgi:hypothetical protein